MELIILAVTKQLVCAFIFAYAITGLVMKLLISNVSFMFLLNRMKHMYLVLYSTKVCTTSVYMSIVQGYQSKIYLFYIQTHSGCYSILFLSFSVFI